MLLIIQKTLQLPRLDALSSVTNVLLRLRIKNHAFHLCILHQYESCNIFVSISCKLYAHLFPHINKEQRFQSIIHWSPVLQGAMFTSCWHNINWSRNFRHEKHGARARGWAGDDVTLPALMSRVWGEQRAAGPHLSDYDRVAWLWYPASVGAGKHDVGDRGMVSEINWRFT